MFYLFIKALILPPGIFIIVGICCFIFYRSRPKIVGVVIGVSALLLYAMSNFHVASALAGLLEPDQALTQNQIDAFGPQAILIMGADRDYDAPEYGGEDAAGAGMLVRLRYGAHLYRQTGLPVLVSGGGGYDHRIPLAGIMADVLQNDFQVPVKWREGKSLTTWENARYSREILRVEGIDRVLVVTHGYHMKRSLESLQQFGFKTLAAPTYFLGRVGKTLKLEDFFPSAKAFEVFNAAIHEYLGLVYYRLVHFSGSA